jgi:hypothetical protein
MLKFQKKRCPDNIGGILIMYNVYSTSGRIRLLKETFSQSIQMWQGKRATGKVKVDACHIHISIMTNLGYPH